MVPDGQEGQIQAPVADELHVAEQRGVASKVQPLAAELDHHAGGHAAVGAVGKAAAVPGGREVDAAPGLLDRSADVGSDGVLHALAARVAADFRRADQRGVTLRQIEGIAPVVAVRVRDQHTGDVHGPDLLDAVLRHRVARDKGIDGEGVRAVLKQKRAVADERNFHGASLEIV